MLLVRHVENIFDSIGLRFIFSNKMSVNVNWIKVNIKQILVDQFVQNWEAKLQTLQEVIFIPSLKNIFV
jgi:hypothetical protein